MPNLKRFFALCSCLLIIGCSTGGQSPTTKSGLLTLTKVVDGFSRPLYLTHAGDASQRLFVVEQTGLIRIIKDGKLLPSPFLNVKGLITNSGNEQGLLGLAFHPDFQQNGTLFVHYSSKEKGETVVARYRVSAQNPDQVDPMTAEIIFTLAQPASNHNGGPLLFGPDGYLYIALGDGGSTGDPKNNAQNLDSLLGKVLRVAVGAKGPYGIPGDNPFVNKPGLDEIWAYGLRNPWRLSFDGATGDLFIADVGQSTFEEINYQPAASPGGQNYGWKVFEANKRFSPGDPKSPVFPVAQYGRDFGCSVIGGYVYRGKAIPSLVGTYLYADYCTGRIWGLTQSRGSWSTQELMDMEFRISSFGEDQAGELYVIDHAGTIYRLQSQ